jgi:hypothetical protein
MEEAFNKEILKKANSEARARQISSNTDNNVDDHDADDGDCADEVDDVSSDDHDADGVDPTDDKDSSDADDSSVDDHDADDSDCDDEIDGENDEIDDAETKRLLERVEREKANAIVQQNAFEKLVRKQDQDKLDSDARIASDVPNAADRKLLEQREKYARKQDQDKLDSDARIAKDKLDSDARNASEVPSAADRKLLEQRQTLCRVKYVQAVRERSNRLAWGYYDNEDFTATENFIHEYEALQERAQQSCEELKAWENVRDVRARWENFERYGHYGALKHSFFDPRNG